MRFTTTVQGSGNKTGIVVPEQVVTELGAGKRPPVVVTIHGKSYRSSIAVMGGQNLISLSYSAQRRYVEPLGEAKTPETRSRRIAKVVEDLKAGKK